MFSLLCLLLFFVLFSFLIGAYGSEVTPVPIPNTEVKLTHVDDTWLATARETKSVPVQSKVSILDRDFFIYSVEILVLQNYSPKRLFFYAQKWLKMTKYWAITALTIDT